MACMVSVLIENPSAAMMPKGSKQNHRQRPASDHVARKLCRKISITKTTSTIASMSV